MSTPGRRRALRALAARKRSNRSRIRRGEKPILEDPRTGKNRTVSLSTFRRQTGVSIRNIKSGK
jgi:hypothetical protein